VPDLTKCLTSDAKRAGSTIALVRGSEPTPMLGSHYARLFGLPDERDESGVSLRDWPRLDLSTGPAAARAVHELIREGLVHSAHDVSDGGVLVALAEMLIGGSSDSSRLGASIVFQSGFPDIADLFSEAPSSYLLEVDSDDAALDRIANAVETHKGVAVAFIGEFTGDGALSVLTSSGERVSWNVEDLVRAWRGTLDW
jgi:phosphoribosylformylglycinamidine synthase subunit PurSL